MISSPQSDFCCTLPRGYAQTCPWNTENAASLRNYIISYITPDGQWRFPNSLWNNSLSCIIRSTQYDNRRQGDVPANRTPAIVKPTTADNSLGVSLIRQVNYYDAALQKALQYRDAVMVEAFIEPGRKVRCGCLVKDGQLIAKPLEEYIVNAQEPTEGNSPTTRLEV